MLWTTQMNSEYARGISHLPVKTMPKGRFSETIRPLLRGSKLGLDLNSIPASRYLSLRKRLKKKIVDASPALSRLRAVKEEWEIAKIAASVRVAKKILCEVEQEIDSRMSEADVHKRLLALSLEHGCEPAFEPIVATGSSTRFPHYKTARAGKRKLNGIVLVDFGVRLDGYCSDLTRCFFLGPCKKEREAYAKAQDILADILGEIPKMKKARELALFSEKRFKTEGLPKPIHSIGHGIGMEVHESPRLNAKSKDSLVPGMALAIEPAAYFKDFGVRYEETIALEKGRARVL
jgi:Xaa-Pro aminopeptidase